VIRDTYRGEWDHAQDASTAQVPGMVRKALAVEIQLGQERIMMLWSGVQRSQNGMVPFSIFANATELLDGSE
jgi:hypothetical protein